MTIKELIHWLKDFEELEGNSIVKIANTDPAAKEEDELLDLESIVSGNGVVTLIADF